MKVKEIKWLSDLQNFLDSLEITNEQKDKIRSYITNDLLAQKEDRKEEQPCNNFKPASNDEGYETTKYPHQCPICKGWRGFCLNCNKDHHENGWDSCNPTPSPIEGFEEIPEIKRMIVYPDICEDLAKVVKEIVENQNTLISNQKKLYQYIKEKI